MMIRFLRLVRNLAVRLLENRLTTYHNRRLFFLTFGPGCLS